MTVSEAERNHIDLNNLNSEEFASLVRNFHRREKAEASLSSRPVGKTPYVFGATEVIFSDFESRRI